MSKNKNHDKNSQKEDKEVKASDDKQVEEATGTENKETDSEEAVVDDVIDSPDSEIEALKNLLQEKEDELKKEKNDYLFLMADFDNFRKRTLKEKSELIKTGSENVLKQLLPVVDDFERGLEAMKSSEDIAAVKEGMELVYNNFRKFFEQNGVKVMETDGEEFDSDKHEALTTIPVEDPDKKNKIVDTITKGYTLGDKVLRHAKVVVGN